MKYLSYIRQTEVLWIRLIDYDNPMIKSTNLPDNLVVLSCTYSAYKYLRAYIYLVSMKNVRKSLNFFQFYKQRLSLLDIRYSDVINTF